MKITMSLHSNLAFRNLQSMLAGSVCWCNLWLISQQAQEFQPQGFESLERQKRGTKLINVAPKFRGLQQRKRSGQIRRNPNRRRKNNGKKNKKRGTRVISKDLVKNFISFLNHGFFRVVFLNPKKHGLGVKSFQ